jgi:hypothetical protein
LFNGTAHVWFVEQLCPWLVCSTALSASFTLPQSTRAVSHWINPQRLSPAAIAATLPPRIALNLDLLK